MEAAGEPVNDETDGGSARVIVVSMGPSASRAVAALETPALDDIERARVGRGPDDAAPWRRVFHGDAAADADFANVDLRPFRSFLDGAMLIIFVASDPEARSMRLERFVAQARDARAVTVVLIQDATNIDDTFGADVAAGVGASHPRDRGISRAVGLFVEPVRCVGIVGWCFQDFREIATPPSTARLGFGQSRGARNAGRSARAARAAIDALGDGGLGTARAVHMAIRGGPDLTMREIEEACEVVHRAAHDDASVIFAADIQPDCGEFQVSLAALGSVATEAKQAPEASIRRPAARELLKLLLDLRAHVPDDRCWTPDALAADAPAFARLRRAIALSRALWLGDDLRAVVRGEFLRTDSRVRYEKVVGFAEAWVAREDDLRWAHVRFERPDEHVTLRAEFRRLLAYREAVHRVQRLHEDTLCGAGLTHLRVVQERRIAAAMAERVEELDELIGRIFDPSGRVVARRELAALGYPEGHLEAIDSDSF